MATINAGYMGWASLGGASVRFTDASVAVQQEVNAPDLIMGDWDRNAWVAGPITVGGSMSGPITENFAAGAGSVFAIASKRSEPCGTLGEVELTLNYYCGGDGGINARTFPLIQIQSLNVSCSAGDVAQFSLEFIGAQEPTPAAYGGRFMDEEKLLTWDALKVTDGLGGLISSFDFTINNNIEAVYAIGSDMNYYPYALVPGLRHISGTVTYYNIPDDLGDARDYDSAHANRGKIGFSLGSGASFEFECAFHRVVPNSSIGPLMSTVAFTGVGNQTTLD